MKEIFLTRGKITLVDDDDYLLVSKFKWYADRGRYTWYAKRHGPNGPIYMHGVIMGGKGVDHLNRNGLDNRRSNLRFANCSQNAFNSRLSKANTSGERGVYWDKRDKKWQAKIEVNYKQISLGYFDSIPAAAKARKAAEDHYGKLVLEP